MDERREATVEDVLCPSARFVIRCTRTAGVDPETGKECDVTTEMEVSLATLRAALHQEEDEG